MQLNIEKPLDEVATIRRRERDVKLLEVDAVAGNALRWASLSDEKKVEWSTYRQALLDVPQQAEFPLNITWPVAPT